MRKIIGIKIILLLLVSPLQLWAQFDETQTSGSDDLEVEALYDRYDEEQQKKQSTPAPAPRAAEKEITSLSDLKELEPFSDVAVIQRKYLPKTQRFELSGSALTSLNNAFFNNYGASLRLGYYFAEKLGIEGQYYYLTDSRRDVTSSLKDNQRINTRSLVVPKSFLGASFKWVPIYGKVALFDDTIVPFDLYFAPGIGMTSTADSGNNFTVQLSTGQMFAISKAFAFRWDFSWNFYQAEVDEDSTGLTRVTRNQSDLFLFLGMSFYFPEASYR